MLSKLLDICISSAEKFIPRRKTTYKKVSCIPSSRKILIGRRSKVNKQLTSTSSEAEKARLMEESRNIEKKLQASYRCQKSDMEHKAIQSIQRNSKYFFSYARKFSKISSGIGPFIDTTNNIATCPSKMASMLAKQYSSVFSTPKETLSDPHVMSTDESIRAAAGDHLDSITFKSECIEKAKNISVYKTRAAASFHLDSITFNSEGIEKAKNISVYKTRSLPGCTHQTVQACSVTATVPDVQIFIGHWRSLATNEDCKHNTSAQKKQPWNTKEL